MSICEYKLQIFFKQFQRVRILSKINSRIDVEKVIYNLFIFSEKENKFAVEHHDISREERFRVGTLKQ